jgi:hypothetical protein
MENVNDVCVGSSKKKLLLYKKTEKFPQSSSTSPARLSVTRRLNFHVNPCAINQRYHDLFYFYETTHKSNQQSTNKNVNQHIHHSSFFQSTSYLISPAPPHTILSPICLFQSKKTIDDKQKFLLHCHLFYLSLVFQTTTIEINEIKQK